MKAPLYEQIYNHLFQKIKDGELKSGDRLPSENELADQFNVSRITTKKALETLAQHRLVERIRGKGSYVSEVLPGSEETVLYENLADPGSDAPAESVKLVGLILPEFAESYGSQLIHGVEERCSQTNCRMLMKLTYDSREVEESAIQSFIDLGVDGFIIFPVHGEHYNTALLRLVLDKFPLVLVDRYLKGIAACSVYTDNQKSVSDLTMHLLERGHKEIGFISVPSDNTSSVEERIAGFSETLIRNGIPFKPQHMMANLRSSLPCSSDKANIQTDIERVREFVELNPELTAFVAAEYNLALVLREVLTGMNKRIPDDVEIVCFDSPPDPFDKPAFTHIRQNELEMGRMAVDMLHGQWSGKDVGLNHLIEHAFVKGLSTT
ncbi:GntR family transcriptional regulator [Paenibacillus sacheonensis]|uniref:Substrate-binding domain-containing protein n=1 Tax=Paenibacillus sacheonensis TaxID=742054 RepID=A0A7X5BYW7_9BACL|nr:GntR family transcriptional regulator [Paenibacillus sacheonensis]MBM7565135.1 DNA-binding LacI/PurR family transcriptional regulator [Paenibacillus sacheonensis]NBC70082.1 substrate-binding domain-containing protein [Paenibacillus sacheonensis]